MLNFIYRIEPRMLVRLYDQMTRLFVHFWQITAMIICPKAFKFAQKHLEFAQIGKWVIQILTEPSSNDQRHFNFYQSSKISSHLVTLDACKSGFKNDKFMEKTNPDLWDHLLGADLSNVSRHDAIVERIEHQKEAHVHPKVGKFIISQTLQLYL